MLKSESVSNKKKSLLHMEAETSLLITDSWDSKISFGF